MNETLKIKICGMKIPENLEEVCALGPDYVGYIFYPGSKRYVGDTPDSALFKIPSADISKVGVFVNEEIGKVVRIFEYNQLDLVQLHGNESPDYCRSIKEAGIPVIKAIDPGALHPIRPSPGISYPVEDYIKWVDLLLFDTPGPGYGGTGRKFDWNLIKGSIPLPFLLGGGIGPEDAKAVRAVSHEAFLGIDLNSRFESSPGMKEVQLVKEFFKIIRK